MQKLQQLVDEQVAWTEKNQRRLQGRHRLLRSDLRRLQKHFLGWEASIPEKVRQNLVISIIRGRDWEGRYGLHLVLTPLPHREVYQQPKWNLCGLLKPRLVFQGGVFEGEAIAWLKTLPHEESVVDYVLGGLTEYRTAVHKLFP